MDTMDTNLFALDVANALTKITGDVWSGLPNVNNPGQGWYVLRLSDGLKLDAYAGISGGKQNPWHITLNLWTGDTRNSRNYQADRLPYFITQEAADAAGKPWGKVAGKVVGGGINVGHGKTADQAARDIIRRLLPLADPAWTCVRASLADSNAYHARATALANELADMTGLVARNDDNGHKIDLNPLLCGGYGDINVYGDSVEMKLRGLSPDQARAVMSALAAVKRNG